MNKKEWYQKNRKREIKKQIERNRKNYNYYLKYNRERYHEKKKDLSWYKKFIKKHLKRHEERYCTDIDYRLDFINRAKKTRIHRIGFSGIGSHLCRFLDGTPNFVRETEIVQKEKIRMLRFGCGIKIIRIEGV